MGSGEIPKGILAKPIGVALLLRCNRTVYPHRCKKLLHGQSFDESKLFLGSGTQETRKCLQGGFGDVVLDSLSVGFGHLAPSTKAKPRAGAGELPAELVQARRFGKTRSAKSAALLEDYVELIADLLGNAGEARPTDIARRLGVSHATAIKTVRRRACQFGTTTSGGKCCASRTRKSS
jgi:hypothetical protein